MRTILIASFFLSGAVTADAAGAPSSKAGGDENAMYALGYQLVPRKGALKALSLNPQEMRIVNRGMVDAATGAAPRVDVSKYFQKIMLFEAARRAQAAAPRREHDEAFLRRMEKKPGAKTLKSGGGEFVFIEKRAGKGRRPALDDHITVSYKIALSDGKTADEQYWGKRRTESPLATLMPPCLSEGIHQAMRPGGEAEIICPSSMAYGDRGWGGIPPGAAVDMTVKLLSVAPPKKYKLNPHEARRQKKRMAELAAEHPEYAQMQRYQKYIEKHPEFAQSPEFQQFLQEFLSRHPAPTGQSSPDQQQNQ